MSTRTILVALLALICGASAAIGVARIGRSPALPAENVDSLPVVTAAADVGRGQVLDAKMLKISRYPKQDVPKGALTEIDDAVGRTVISALVKSEPLVVGKLADKAAGRGLAAIIPSGMRAFTIQTPHLAADVGGFVMPGNHVDVLLTTSPSGPSDQTGGGVTTTLLQNVQVLAVAQKLEAPEDSKLIANDIKIVTLLVTPDQAAKLDLAMNKGILHLALRNPGDDREAATRPATMNDLRFHQEKPINVADLLKLVAAVMPAPRPTPVKPKEPPLPVKPKEPEIKQATYTEILTLRGTDAGSVRIALPR